MYMLILFWQQQAQLLVSSNRSLMLHILMVSPINMCQSITCVMKALGQSVSQAQLIYENTILLQSQRNYNHHLTHFLSHTHRQMQIACNFLIIPTCTFVLANMNCFRNCSNYCCYTYMQTHVQLLKTLCTLLELASLISLTVCHAKYGTLSCIYILTSICSLRFLFLFLVNLLQVRNKNVCNSFCVFVAVGALAISNVTINTRYRSVSHWWTAMPTAFGKYSIWNLNGCHGTTVAQAVVVALMRLLYYFVLYAHMYCSCS